MSSDQITYVLVAFIVTGVAILLLLAGALFARRGRAESRASEVARIAPVPPAPSPSVAYPVTDAPPAPIAPAPAVAAVAVEAPAAPLAPAPEPSPAMPDGAAAVAGAAVQVHPPATPDDAPVAAEASAPAEAAPEEPAVTSADRAAAAQRLHDPREEEIIAGFLSASPRRREAVAFESPRPPSVVGPAPSEEAPPMPATPAPFTTPAPASATPADPYVDEITGLDSRAAWDRALEEENARYVRYRRPVSVVLADLDGLARFEHEFGDAAARRIMGAVGDALRRNARRTDRVAHAGSGRYLVLLPETDEIQAINYVERIRGECDRWLEAGAVALRVSLGWASPSAVGELDTALRTAEERMFAERRRATRTGANGPDGSR